MFYCNCFFFYWALFGKKKKLVGETEICFTIKWRRRIFSSRVKYIFLKKNRIWSTVPTKSEGVMGSIRLYFLAARWVPLFPGPPTLGPSHSLSYLFIPASLTNALRAFCSPVIFAFQIQCMVRSFFKIIYFYYFYYQYIKKLKLKNNLFIFLNCFNILTLKIFFKKIILIFL